MVILTPSDIAEFKAIYKAEFGTELSDSQAYEKAHSLVSLMQIIYRPIPNKEQKPSNIGAAV